MSPIERHHTASELDRLWRETGYEELGIGFASAADSPKRETALIERMMARPLFPAASAAKPLPAGTRLVCTCVCGRVILRRELFALIAPPACPDCGSSLRIWERCPATWLDKLIAWFRLQCWKLRPNP